MDHLVFPDEEFVIPADLDQYSAELAARFPEQRTRIPVFLRDLVRLYRQMLRRTGPLLDRYRPATYDQMLSDYFDDPRLKRVLAAQWGYLGSPAEEISAVGMCQMLVSYLRDGAYYPLGSTQAFSNALARSLLNEGAHVLLRKQVVEILVDGACVAGVRLDNGKTVHAPVVVSNVDARQLFEDLLPRDVCQPERQRIRSLRAAPSFYGLYLAVSDEVDLAKLPRGFYYLPEEHGADAVEWIYLSVTTRYDASLAPAGAQIISMTVGVPPSSPAFVAWQGDKRAMEQTVLRYLETRVPGLSQHVEFIESASPRTLARYTLARDGVAYGWAVLPDQAGDNRLPSETSLPGLYLTGQWTSPGPGVAAVAASGWSASQRVLGG
jgi:prolycopene isomerase